MYKYLSDYHKEVFERVKENLLKHNTIDSFLNQQLRLLKISYRKSAKNLTVKGIIDAETEDGAYKKLIILEADEIKLDELQKNLKDYIRSHTPSCLKNNPELKRLIRIYDLLKYK